MRIAHTASGHNLAHKREHTLRLPAPGSAGGNTHCRRDLANSRGGRTRLPRRAHSLHQRNNGGVVHICHMGQIQHLNARVVLNQLPQAHAVDLPPATRPPMSGSNRQVVSMTGPRGSERKQGNVSITFGMPKNVLTFVRLNRCGIFAVPSCARAHTPAR